MNPGRFPYRCMAIVTSLVFLNGCVVPTAPTPTFPSTTPLPATNTPTPSPVLPTRTPLPTPTPKPPMPTVPPSPTLAPTLTADQEQALVLDLLQNNAGCRLPCWWGFTPGKTAWQTAYAFFASLGKMPAEGDNNYAVVFHIPQHDVQIGQLYSLRDGLIEAIWVSAGTVRNGERIYGDEQFAKDLQRYFLPQLLTTYGQPTEVLLRTFRSVPEGTFIPFNLLLFYPQRGILVRYYGPTERIGERIRVCPQQTDITLWLSSPEQILTLEDIRGPDFPIEEVPEFRSIEKSTGMSLETFYKTFKNADNRLCLETPVDMWP